MCRAARCIRARFTAQLDAEESRHVLAGEPVPLPGLDGDVRAATAAARAATTGSAMGSTTLSPEASDRYFDFPYCLTQGTWTATATNRLLLEAGVSRLAYPGGAGTGSPDGALNLIQVVEQAAHRRPPGQLRVPRHQHRRRQLPEHQELARLGVVRDGRAQHEGRLPGRLSRRRTAASITGESAAHLPLQQRRAEPVHLPASGFPDGQSDDDVGPLRPGHLDARPAVAAGRAALRPRLELGPGRGQRDHRDVAVQRGADSVRADGQRRRVSTTSRRAAVRPTTSSATARRRSSSPSAATWRRRPTTPRTRRTTRRAAS